VGFYYPYPVVMRFLRINTDPKPCDEAYSDPKSDPSLLCPFTLGGMMTWIISGALLFQSNVGNKYMASTLTGELNYYSNAG